MTSKALELTSLTANVDRKEYTPLMGTRELTTEGDTRPMADLIASLKESLDKELANKDLDPIDSLTHLLNINRILRQSRENIENLSRKVATDKWSVSFDAEAHGKLVMYAEQEYEELIQEAVKCDISELLVRMIVHQVHDEASLVLLNELSSGGFIVVQNALYFTTTEYQDQVLGYLQQHLQQDSTGILNILQQLCVYHHGPWQSVMRLPVQDGPSFLDVVLARVASLDLTSVGISEAGNIIALFNFLCEACQGPSIENQFLVADSPAITTVRDIVFDGVKYDPVVPETTFIEVQRCASEVLLTLMEGRTDDIIHERLASLLSVSMVSEQLQLNYRIIQEKLYSPSGRTIMQHTLNLTKSLLHTDSKDEQQRHMKEFRASVNVVRIIKHLLNDKHPSETPSPEFQVFQNQWNEVVTNGKVYESIAFFQEQLISVEITRSGTTFTTYFLRPRAAKYFNETLKEKLLDHMDIGSEGALDVLASEVAKDVEEELAVIQYLNKNPFYSMMNDWNLWLRKNMLRLCLYINFVMLLCVRVDNSTMVDIQNTNMHSGLWVVGVLGFVLLGFCSVLWIYHLLTTFCFNYSKQQATTFKLSFTTSSEFWKSSFNSFSHFAVNFEFFIAIFAVIFYMDLVTAVTKALAVFASLWLFGNFLYGVRSTSGLYRFTVNVDTQAHTNIVLNVLSFWFNVIYDTLIASNVITFGVYTLCTICGLGLSIPAVTQYFSSGPWGLMFFGFPLVDILATNEQLRFIATAMHSNMGKLGVTAIFGAIVIYIFSLVGFFMLQSELQNEDHTISHCTTLLQCYSTYIRYGLLSGGGIGDYISSTLNHELDFNNPTWYFERLVYDMAFYVIVITLFLNMIQGIIIDAFTSVREATETKENLKRERCLVCNRSRNAIELEGVDLGLLNNFSRHTLHEHNLFHYFFYIQHVSAKDPKELNGIESYVVEKLKTQDMSWIPRV